jgi:pSer/pThr/pTyr-binding forkhead associated (FHA) protein
MITVEIETPDGVQQYTSHAERVTIGRLGANDIVLPYSHISRRHAELRWFNGAWWIADLHSTNGLHVSGQRVQETPLEPGESISLSPHVSLRLIANESTNPPRAIPAPPSAPYYPTPAPGTPPPAAEAGTTPLAPTPLAALGPRSPFAEDETPYYPRMRPSPADSRPRPSPRPAPRPSQPPGAPDAIRRAQEIIGRRTAPATPNGAAAAPLQPRRHYRGPGNAALHICQTCGQLTAPDAVYCQNCHHSIATECPNCRLNLLPVQETCPRCQSPNPGAAGRSRRTSK